MRAFGEKGVLPICRRSARRFVINSSPAPLGASRANTHNASKAGRERRSSHSLATPQSSRSAPLTEPSAPGQTTRIHPPRAIDAGTQRAVAALATPLATAPAPAPVTPPIAPLLSSSGSPIAPSSGARLAALLLERYEGRAAALESQLRASQEEAAGWQEEAEAPRLRGRAHLRHSCGRRRRRRRRGRPAQRSLAEEAASLQAKIEELQVRGGTCRGPTMYSGDP